MKSPSKGCKNRMNALKENSILKLLNYLKNLRIASKLPSQGLQRAFIDVRKIPVRVLEGLPRLSSTPRGSQASLATHLLLYSHFCAPAKLWEVCGILGACECGGAGESR